MPNASAASRRSKDAVGEATTSKAIWAAVRDYPATRQLAKAERRIEELEATLAQVAAAAREAERSRQRLDELLGDLERAD